MSWNPTIEIASAYGVREVRIQSKLLSEGKIFLNGEITSQTVDEVLSQLFYLKTMGITPCILINSGGGSVTAGLAICDCIKAFPGEVTIVVSGIAASMAAVILSCGTKGRRFILPHSEVMIHEPLIGDCPGGNASAMRRRSDSLLKTRDITSGILAENTGHTLEEVNSRIEHDFYMSSLEAVDFGIVDAILEDIYSL